MKVPYYEGKKHAQLFSHKDSGSLVIHENVPEKAQNEFYHFIEMSMFS